MDTDGPLVGDIRCAMVSALLSVFSSDVHSGAKMEQKIGQSAGWLGFGGSVDSFVQQILSRD